MEKFYVYGDNIVECERFFELVCDSFGGYSPKLLPTRGTPFKPIRTLGTTLGTFEFIFIPGFGRWKNDIFEQLHSANLILREAADIILAKENNGKISIILAIEFCSALHAGNQAWQRHGRGYALSKHGIPYVYLSTIGGQELGSERVAKAARLPNAAVPFSFISFAKEFTYPTFPIYIKSPEYVVSNLKLDELVFGEKDLAILINDVVRTGKINLEILKSITSRTEKFVNELSKNTGSEALKLSDFLKKNWKKKVSIPTTPAFKKLLEQASALGAGIGELPICVIEDEKNKKLFCTFLQKNFNLKPNAFESLMLNKSPIGLVFVAGFKPRGDDSRPDRGLIPLARMLLGEQANILSIVYGPIKDKMYHSLSKSSIEVVRSNGLIQSLINISNFVLFTPSSAGLNPLLVEGNFSKFKRNPNFIIPNEYHPVGETPSIVGEQDVDSAIHLIFKEPQNNIKIFEGLCNPPGGDWAGISLMDLSGTEFRWISLPRVTEKSKRPDHVLQLFTPNENYILVIESKDTVGSIEDNIGNRLKWYLDDLLVHEPSVIKKTTSWSAAKNKFDSKPFKYITAVAFLKGSSNKNIDPKKWNVDLIFEFSVEKNDMKLSIQSITELGANFKNLLSTFKFEIISQ